MTPSTRVVQRTLQIAGTQPSFWPIRRHSVWTYIHGHPWTVSLSRSGSCGRCCSTISARTVMRCLPHEWSCRERHDCLNDTTRQSVYESCRPLSIATLLTVLIVAQAKCSRVNRVYEYVRKWDVEPQTAAIVAAQEWGCWTFNTVKTWWMTNSRVLFRMVPLV